MDLAELIALCVSGVGGVALVERVMAQRKVRATEERLALVLNALRMTPVQVSPHVWRGASRGANQAPIQVELRTDELVGTSPLCVITARVYVTALRHEVALRVARPRHEPITGRLLHVTRPIMCAWRGQSVESSAPGFMMGFWGDRGCEPLFGADGSVTEPLLELSCERGWLTLSRLVTRASMRGDGVSQPAWVVQMAQLAQQQLSALYALIEAQPGADEQHEALWYAAWLGAARGAHARESALHALWTAGEGARGVWGEQAWGEVMTRGEFGEVVVALEVDEARVLATLTEAQLIAWVNGALGRRGVDAVWLVRVVAPRLALSVLYEGPLVWWARMVLLKHWSTGLERRDARELADAVARMMARPDAPRRQIQAELSGSPLRGGLSVSVAPEVSGGLSIAVPGQGGEVTVRVDNE